MLETLLTERVEPEFGIYGALAISTRLTSEAESLSNKQIQAGLRTLAARMSIAAEDGDKASSKARENETIYHWLAKVAGKNGSGAKDALKILEESAFGKNNKEENLEGLEHIPFDNPKTSSVDVVAVSYLLGVANTADAETYANKALEQLTANEERAKVLIALRESHPDSASEILDTMLAAGAGASTPDQITALTALREGVAPSEEQKAKVRELLDYSTDVEIRLEALKTLTAASSTTEQEVESTEGNSNNSNILDRALNDR